MPLTSMQVSGLIGGQQAMFANQAAYAQQLGGVGQIGAGMQNPYPAATPSYAAPGWEQGNAGTHIAGAMGMAAPAAMGMAAMGGGLMGGAAGWADPVTASARFFARGAGFAGQGAGATLSGIGSQFSQGGLRAGLGPLAGDFEPQLFRQVSCMPDTKQSRVQGKPYMRAPRISRMSRI